MRSRRSVRLVSKPLKPGSRRQRLRTLGFESLEQRRLLASVPIIIDDSDNPPAFVKSSEGWTQNGPNGYRGSASYSSAPYDGDQTATWTFDVSPGVYRIAATWKGTVENNVLNTNYGENVPVTLFDGSEIIVTARLNQHYQPNDFQDRGVWWENIGTYSVNHSLKIIMSDDSNKAAIADAFRVERVEQTLSPIIVDNSSPSFWTNSNWYTYGPAGYGGTISFPSAPYDGGDVASWTINVSPGTYRVSATWHSGYHTYGSNVPVAVYDGTTSIGFTQLNQKLYPYDLYDQGTWWEDIGYFTVGSSLQVIMTDNTDGIPIADAIRVQRIVDVTTTAIVDNTSSGFTTTGSWTSYSTPGGYAGTIAFPAAPYTGSDSATWAFNVSPGTYRIAATWHSGYYTYGGDVQVHVYDSDDYIGTAFLNQKISPDDFVSQNKSWENIGVFTIWDSLQIRMFDNANGIPIADAFRIERVSAEVVPIAQDDNKYFTPVGTDLVIAGSGSDHLLKNDDFIGGVLTTASVLSQPSHGTLIAFDTKGGFTYRPNPGYIGVDKFTYQVLASNLEKSSATVAIAVGTPLLPRKNLDANMLNTSTPDPWLQMSLLDSESPFAGFGIGYDNIPNGSSAETDGALAATGGLLLIEDVAPETALSYRSDALTRPVIAVDTRLAPGVPAPTSLTAKLTFNGVAGTEYTYATSGLAAEQELRFALQADGSSLPTGMYDYTVDVNLTVNGIPVTQTFSGKQAIVNRSQSEFGSGWGLIGLDRLYDQVGGALLVRGSGDSFWFPLVGGVYNHAAGDTSYSRLQKLVDNSFTLTSKYGIVSKFSSTGLLTSRVDTNANTITFGYSDKDNDSAVDELVSITDPFGRTTNFGYSGTQLSSITHYSGRETALTLVNGRLDTYQLTDPDPNDSIAAPVTSFIYLADQLTRINALGESTSYNFDANDGRLRSVDLPFDPELPEDPSLSSPPAPPKNYRWLLTPIDSVGLPSLITPITPATPASAHALVTDGRENVWEFRTDRFGGIIHSKSPLGHVWQYQRDKDGQAYSMIEPDPDGPTGVLQKPVNYWGYNSSSDLVMHQLPDGSYNYIAHTFDLHRPRRIKNSVGDTQSYGYDSRGNHLSTVDGAGYFTRLVVNSRGLPISITLPDPDGSGPLLPPVSLFTYDAYSRLVTLTHPDNSTRTYAYNTANQLTSSVDELGKTSVIAHDALGRVISSTNRVGAVVHWQYDALSRLTKETAPLLGEMDVQYTKRGQIDKTIHADPDGPTFPLNRPIKNYSYDANGNVLSEGDASGNFSGQIPYTYDEDNRLSTMGSAVDGQPVEAIETYRYDAVGRLISIAHVPYVDITDPGYSPQDPFPEASDEILLSYDSLGRLIERISRQKPNAGGQTFFRESFEYDQAGRLIRTIDGEGNVSTNEYDGRGLLIRESLPDPDGNGSQFPLVIKHQYDQMGRLIATDRGFGRVTKYEYSNRNWLMKTTEPDPDGVSGPATAPSTYFGYDLRGDPTTVTDPMNRTTTFTYDNEQRLILRTDPDPDGSGPLLAGTTTWSYNANDWMTSFTDAVYATTDYQYDALGRVTLIEEPDPDGTGPLARPVSNYVYDEKGLQSIIDPMGRTTSYQLDKRGRVSMMTDTAGANTLYHYDFYDNLRKRTDPDPDGPGPQASSITRFVFDGFNQLKEKIEPGSGSLTQFEYDSASNLRFVTDPRGHKTEYKYDNLNRVIEEKNASNASRHYVYDVAGNLTRSLDRNGRVVEYDYDAQDRLIDEYWQPVSYLPSTATVSTLQDGRSVAEVQVVGWNDPPSAVTHGGTFTLSQGGFTTAAIPYDANAVVIQAALAALPNIGQGNVSVEFTETDVPHDYSNQTFKIIYRGALAGQNLPQTTINTSQLIVSPSTPLIITQQTVVQGGLITEKQKIQISWGTNDSAPTSSWYLAYAGEVSNPLPRSASAGQVEAALEQFAGIDNVSVSNSFGFYEITFGGTQASTDMQQIMADVAGLHNTGNSTRRITSQYNSVGELNVVTERTANFSPGQFRHIYYGRDNLGRTTSITHVDDFHVTPSQSYTLSMDYDAAGNRTRMSANLNGTPDFANTYSYDKLRRLTEITQSGQAGGPWIAPKRVVQEFNALGQRTKISRFDSLTTAHPVANTDFLYDSANRLYYIDHRRPNNTTLNAYYYQYDAMSRVTGATSGIDGLTHYTYDQQSQLIGVDNAQFPDESFSYDLAGNRNATGYTTDPDNRTVSAPGWTYQYDAEGNMTQASNGQTVWSYTWDHRNRLVKAHTFGLTIEYEYDVYNRLIKRGGTRYYYDDGINPVMEQQGPNSRKFYLWSDAVDDLLAAETLFTGGSTDHVLWPLPDRLGTINDIADRDNSTGITGIINHRRYDAFGQQKSETNAAVDLVFGYSGKLFDEATGLQNNLHRWYNPQLGRFISPDPIGFAAGDANLYRYVGNDPVGSTDPFGLQEGPSSRSVLRSVFGGSRQNSNPANQSRAGNLAAASGLYSTDRHRRAFEGALHVQDAFAELTPGAGQIYSGAKAVTGYNPITNQRLGIVEIGLAALGILAIPADDALRAGRGAIRRHVDDVVENYSGFVSVAPNRGLRLSEGAGVGPYVDEAKLLKILGNLESRGVRVVRGDEAASVLENAGAAYVNWFGKPHLYLRDKVTRGQLVEELLHHGQSLRRGHAASPGGVAMQRLTYLDEIAAQRYMIDHATRKGWTQAEINFYKSQLVRWQKRLDALGH